MAKSFRIGLKYSPTGDVLQYYFCGSRRDKREDLIDKFCIEEEYAKYFKSESSAKAVLTKLTKKFSGISSAIGDLEAYFTIDTPNCKPVRIILCMESVPYSYHFTDIEFRWYPSHEITRPFRYFSPTTLVKYEYLEEASKRNYGCEQVFTVRDFHPPVYHDCDDYGTVVATDGSVHSAQHLIEA